MKDPHKNMIAILLITIIVVILTEYFDLGTGMLWLGIILGITLWLIVTPFKIYDDVS